MSNSPPQEKRKPEPTPGKPGDSGYRGGIFDQIDVPAVTSFTACLLLFILALVGIRNVDYSKLDKPSLEQISERVAKIIMPLKPPGKPMPKPAPPAGGSGRPRGAAGTGKGDATALARIERSRATVAQQITKVQERITKAAVLSILSGKGPGTTGRTVGRAPGGKGGGDRFAGFGDLDARMGSIEGLTKFDGKKGDFNREGSAPARRNGEADAQTSDLDHMAKGFATAKSNIGSKMGVANLETPVATDRSAKFTGNRSPSDVAAFIARKQATVSLLYEERLKSNPALEGKITVVMIIEEDGTISNVSVLRSETTLDDPDFTEELLQRIKRWIFPPSTGGPVEMKSPFVFRPA